MYFQFSSSNLFDFKTRDVRLWMPPEMVLVIHQLNAKTRVASKVATVLQGKNNPPN